MHALSRRFFCGWDGHLQAIGDGLKAHGQLSHALTIGINHERRRSVWLCDIDLGAAQRCDLHVFRGLDPGVGEVPQDNQASG
ncbi:MAG: hypothetical protein O3A21_05040 [Proteobacteria bacterium]|nr:hypothetical protein [Pseudomonadota bacterium]